MKVAVDETNLINIANSIRNKSGSSDTYKPGEMSAAIDGIPSAYPPDWSNIGYSDTPQAIIDGYNYAKEIYDNWNPNITNMYGKYSQDKNLIYFPLVDTSNVTTMVQTFSSCQKLVEIPLLNTSKVTNLTYAFFGTKIIKLPLLDTHSVTSMDRMVYMCDQLVDVPVLDTSKVTNFDYFVSDCYKLSDESLNNIMQMCINATSYNGIKKLKQIGLSANQVTRCQSLSNYQNLIDAGWITGY